MAKIDDLRRQYEADLSERVIYGYLHSFDDTKVMPLMIADKSNRLNIEELKIFLKDVSRSEEIMNLLIELNTQKKDLPDFISKHEDGVIEFHEVKHWKKVKLSQVSQKESFKKLANKGFMCFLVNVIGPDLSRYFDEDGLRTHLKWYGKEKKRDGLNVKYPANVLSRYKTKDTQYPLIKIIEYEWKFDINNPPPK